MDPPNGSGRRRLALGLCLAVLACGPDVYEARGVIREILPAEHQVEIEHEEIPGFMGAMTMRFAVPDPALLARMQVGQTIGFRIEHESGRVRVVDFWPAQAPPVAP